MLRAAAAFNGLWQNPLKLCAIHDPLPDTALPRSLRLDGLFGSARFQELA